MSRLDYCNAVLGGVSKTAVARRQCLQNSAARMITRSKKSVHITPLFIALHWLPVNARIDFKILLLVFKALNGVTPQYIRDLLVEYHAQRMLRSSDMNLLVIPKSRLSSMGDRSFSVYAPRLWNGLPLSLRKANSLVSFKGQLKTYLFKRSFNG